MKDYAKIRDAEVLRSFMKSRNFSTSRLARYAGCHRSFIGHLMTGARTTCSPQLAFRIEEALGIPEGIIFDAIKSPSEGTRSNQRLTLAA